MNSDGTMNTTSVYQMLFGGTSVENDRLIRNFTSRKKAIYWLASDYANANNNNVNWGLRNVNDGDVDGLCLCSSYEYQDSRSYGVRPVVSLKSDVSLEWNETAKEWKIK